MSDETEHDFSSGKRGSVHSNVGKTRITIYVDTDVLDAFRTAADREGRGRGYQTVINEALRAAAFGGETLESRLRKVIQEEFTKHAGRP